MLLAIKHLEYHISTKIPTRQSHTSLTDRLLASTAPLECTRRIQCGMPLNVIPHNQLNDPCARALFPKCLVTSIDCHTGSPPLVWYSGHSGKTRNFYRLLPAICNYIHRQILCSELFQSISSVPKLNCVWSRHNTCSILCSKVEQAWLGKAAWIYREVMQ